MAPGAATAPRQSRPAEPMLETGLSVESYFRALPTVPATDPISSVKMLLGSAAAQGSGNKA